MAAHAAAMAHCFGVSMAHHEEPQVALHLLAGTPTGCAWKSSQITTAIPCGSIYRSSLPRSPTATCICPTNLGSVSI